MLLLRLERLLLRLLPLLRPLLALARPLRLLLLACPPLRPASLRLIVPRLEDEREEEEELRDAIACSFGALVAGRRAARSASV